MASSRLLVLLLLLLSSLSLSLPLIGGGSVVVGGRHEIKDVASNKEVQALGKFAVEQYNRELKRRNSPAAMLLTFLSVVEAQSQVVAGTKYYMKVDARGADGARKVFDAVVVVKPWLKSKQLVAFTPSVN